MQEIKEKTKETNIKKYGCSCPLQNNDIREKQIDTCLDKYGTPYAISSNDVREKIKKTFKERYGVDNPSQDNEIMDKIIKSKYSNGNQTTSKQQNLLCEYLNGELNYPFKRFFIDIAFPEEKIAIEYIGGGYNLSVKLGNISEYEFERNENFRKKMMFENGWRLIEFISLKNNITSKDDSINIYKFCKNLINNNNKHYIKIYIDENRIMNKNNTICYKDTLNDWNEKTSLNDEGVTVCSTV